MPTQATARPFAAPMPTFMSVFGEEINREGTVGIAPGSPVDALKRPATAGNILQSPSSSTNPAPFSIFHQHRDSTSTSASESTDSSPTTTISTIDSASMTEPSPGPSPESPALKTSPTSFVPDFRSRIASTSAEAGQPPFFELQRPTTPAKKARNLKNLAVNTASASNLNRAISPAPLPQLVTQVESTASAPASPSFVKPPTPPKRRPSNLALTIQTPANSLLPTRLTIPSTPSLKRPPTLRHFQSSPSLPLCSPGMPPEGGMTLQPLRTFKPQPHGFSEVPFEDEEEEDQEPNFDVPQSREEKPAAYPNGPICIYESGVYLYYEPSADQAANYDVILNVASEVKNPFTVAEEAAKRIVDGMELDSERSKSEPASTIDTVPADFAIAALAGDSISTEQSNTPTTPKAVEKVDQVPLQSSQPFTIPATQNRPEYIHIPWEHNTDIVPDLYKLVKIIEDRVEKKKRVLVHCQCGVSRSASLIVAYGLYKNPGISVQEAYDAVKKRSKWIGPNMNLIMQLQEFRNGLLRANGDRAFHNQVYGVRKPMSLLSPGQSLDGRKLSPYESDSSIGSRTPRTAPLPPEGGVESTGLRASTGNMEAVSAGPFPAPTPWSDNFRRSWASPSASNFELSPRQPVPFSPTDIPLIDTNIPSVPILNTSEDSAASTLSERVDSGTSESIEAELKSIQQVSLPESAAPETPTNVALESVEPAVAPVETAVEPTEAEMQPMEVTVEPIEATLAPIESPSTRPISKVPNFSRQLPPARLDSDGQQPSGPAEQLLSPRSEEFHMVPLLREDYDNSYGILSPHGPMQDAQSDQSSSLEDTLKSPTFGGFPAQPFMHQPAPIRLPMRDDAGLMSPGLGGGFPKDPFAFVPPPTRPAPTRPAFSDDAFGLMSPGLNGSFPRDPFPAAVQPVEPDLASPRSEEFHMTALQPPADEESFGLTSPRGADELHQPTFSRFFEQDTLNEKHTMLPQHVHPILPPGPSALNANSGQFLGMDATASAPSLPQAPSFDSSSPTPTPAQPYPPPKIEETPPEEIVAVPAVPAVPAETEPELPQTPPRPTISLPSSSPRSTYLTTPPRNPTIRTRFSSPNLSQQRRLHKLQTEIETKLLPSRSPPRGDMPQTQDDTAALMSPRATEFTKNPFHFELPIETPIQRTHGFDFGFDPNNHSKDAWASQATKDDPRSPVMAGSSPIVRNIWDVL